MHGMPKETCLFFPFPFTVTFIFVCQAALIAQAGPFGLKRPPTAQSAKAAQIYENEKLKTATTADTATAATHENENCHSYRSTHENETKTTTIAPYDVATHHENEKKLPQIQQHNMKTKKTASELFSSPFCCSGVYRFTIQLFMIVPLKMDIFKVVLVF